MTKIGYLMTNTGYWMTNIGYLMTKKRKEYREPVNEKNGFLLPKLFWPTVRKMVLVVEKKLLKFEAESPEFAKFLRSFEQLIQTVKGQNNFWQFLLF